MEPVERKTQGRWAHLILALLFALSAIYFVIGGVALAVRGGSPYYLLCGIALLALVWGLLRNRAYVGPLYAGIFGATLVWSVWEAGFDFWPLFSRMFIFIVAGALLAFALPSLRRNAGAPAMKGAHFAIGGVLALAAVALFADMFADRGIYNFAAPTARYPVTAATEQKNWDNYANNPEAERFVALDQINRGNVGNLEVAWVYRHGDLPISPNAGGFEDQGTPLQIGNTLYFCTPKNNIVAVDATSGKQRWKALVGSTNNLFARCRGIVYYDASGRQPNRAQAGVMHRANYVAPADGGPCPRRILTANTSNGLVAINADTGAFCPDFGRNGRVDLSLGMGDTPNRNHHPNSSPTLAGDVVVVGGYVNDNIDAGISSGVVRAYDVRTGAMRWAWDSGNPDPRRRRRPIRRGRRTSGRT